MDIWTIGDHAHPTLSRQAGLLSYIWPSGRKLYSHGPNKLASPVATASPKRSLCAFCVHIGNDRLHVQNNISNMQYHMQSINGDAQMICVQVVLLFIDLKPHPYAAAATLYD